MADTDTTVRRVERVARDISLFAEAAAHDRRGPGTTSSIDRLP
jgi:hypothetical protein